MAKHRIKIASATAAVDWTDLKASGQPLNGVDAGAVIIRTSQASRIAVGVTDPGTSGTAGHATVADKSNLAILGAAAANQSIWVQTPADQSSVYVEIDIAYEGKVDAVFS